MQKHVVPQTGFEVAFDLGEVEIGAGAARDELSRIVEKEQREIEQRP